MPHLTVEYSKNLEAKVDIGELVSVLHATAADIEALPVGGLRTRAVAREHYQIADGHPDNTFVNLLVRLAPTRPFDVRTEIGETLFQALCQHLETVYASTPLAISFEIQEMGADLRWKQNNLREYMARRSEEV